MRRWRLVTILTVLGLTWIKVFTNWFIRCFTLPKARSTLFRFPCATCWNRSLWRWQTACDHNHYQREELCRWPHVSYVVQREVSTTPAVSPSDRAKRGWELVRRSTAVYRKCYSDLNCITFSSTVTRFRFIPSVGCKLVLLPTCGQRRDSDQIHIWGELYLFCVVRCRINHVGSLLQPPRATLGLTPQMKI